MSIVGTHIDHYRILEKVDEGAIGVVCKALDVNRDETRILQIVRPATAGDQEFMRHLRGKMPRLIRLNHPNILRVYAFHEKGPTPFMVTEYVERSSLEDVIRDNGPLEMSQALSMMKQVLQGLAYVHRQGVVHGHLTPHNIFLSNGGQVKLADVGLTRKRDGTELTSSALPLKWLYYLAPEHVRSAAQVDHRSDLYSAGMVLYEALTGRLPLREQETAYLVMRAIIEEPFQSVGRWAPTLPEALKAVVMKAIAKDPDRRFPSAGAMDEALQAVEAAALRPDKEAEAEPETTAARSARFRWPVGYLIGFIVFVLTAALAWWVLRDVIAPSNAVSLIEVDHAHSVTIRPGVYERILSSVVPTTSRQGVLLLKAAPYGRIVLEDGVTGEDSMEVTVEMGRHRIVFSNPVYGEREVEVRVGPGQRKEVVSYFEGYLRIQAGDENGLPLPADIYVDHQATGSRTPLEEPFPLAPGTYTIELFVEGYLGAASTVEVLPIDSMTAAPPVASLDVVLQKIE
ncbi:MAG: serine/threonine protein kinase [Rhodothermales bacterium]